MAQGLPRWPRKLETEQEFAILILTVILFLISSFTLPLSLYFSNGKIAMENIFCQAAGI